MLKIMLYNLEVMTDMGNAYAFGFVYMLMALHTARSYLQMSDPIVSYSFLNVYRTHFLSIINLPTNLQSSMWHSKKVELW